MDAFDCKGEVDTMIATFINMTYGNALNGGQAISFLNQINRSNNW